MSASQVTRQYIPYNPFVGNKECPTCRKKLVSRRSLRPDPNFDALLSKIFPDREEYEEQQEKVRVRPVCLY